ncbi:MAG TPA: hypothetical protein PL155_00455 [Candidatus Omnitrophota bacterium]|nr:hypothetical protein [Candidatus Omnitrophota bacterium]HPD85043.1 hypothetical protein [Candidatus Omnitrophota bacterium]HRZ03901.1 hypothetical protein [Candidatus Omnitrophota bacterium]
MSRRGVHHLLAASAVLVALGLTLYTASLSFPFILDSVPNLAEVSAIKSFHQLAGYFLPRYPESIGTSIGVAEYYRPLGIVAYLSECLLFGENSAGWNLISLLMHITVAILVYLFSSRIIPDRKYALLAAMIFLVHPVQVETVCMVSCVIASLSAVFILSALLLFQNGIRTGSVKWPAVGMILFLYAFALLSKESSIILPFLIFAYDVLCAQKRNVFKIVRENLLLYGGLLIVVLVFFCFRIYYLKLGYSWNVHTEVFPERFLTSSKLFLGYLRIMLFPFDLHYFRAQELLQFHFNLSAVAYLLLWPLLILLTLVFKKIDRVLCFGWLWFIITLFPTLPLVLPLYLEGATLVVSDHFLYFPSIGFSIFTAAVLLRVKERISFLNKDNRDRWFYSGVCALIILPLFGTTLSYQPFWKSDLAIFKRSARFEPGVARIREGLGDCYYLEGSWDLAISEYQSAVASSPRSLKEGVTRKYQDAIFLNLKRKLATSYLNKGMIRDAAREFEDLIKRQEKREAGDCIQLAVLYNQIKEYDRAEEILTGLLVGLGLENKTDDRALFIKNFLQDIRQKKMGKKTP